MNNNLYYLVDEAIDNAFTRDRFILDLYQYAKSHKMTAKDMSEFLMSSVAEEVKNLILELDEYLKGGRDNEHQQLREAYGNIPKPRARKIRNYLYQLIQDAYRYEQDFRRKKRL
tara:strand:- start:407 stop:748 length:342 start_codon:yes stop_codon:yes gene_type:complete